MESYSLLMEKTRVPQASLQKHAVISIFNKLGSAPPHLGLDSPAGIDAITQCLTSTSPAVVEQSVREICLLVVKDSKLDIHRALLELQAALEAASVPILVNVFVKGLGFLVRFGFQNHLLSSQSSQNHPFIKILSCGAEVHSQLVQQVLAFFTLADARTEEICEFMRLFFNYAIIQVSNSVSFLYKLISEMCSLCCSLPGKSIPTINLLISCLSFFPCNNSQDVSYVLHSIDCVVDAYLIVLTKSVNVGLPVREAQLYVVELLEAIFSLHRDLYKYGNGVDTIVKIARHSLLVQKNLGLSFLPEFSTIKMFLFTILIKSQLEHEQLSIAKFITFLLKWENEHKSSFVKETSTINEELLYILPIFSLQSSPSVSVKRAAKELLSVLGKLSIEFLNSPPKQLDAAKEFTSSSTPESVIFRCVKHLWFQDRATQSCHSYLHLVSIGDSPCQYNICEPWISLLTEYSMWLMGKRKSSASITESQELFLTEMPLMLSAISSVIIMNPTLSSYAIDLLVACGALDPSLTVSLLLTILFFNHIFSGERKDIDVYSMLLKLLHMLPSLASHPAMVPLVVQTILPMLQKDTNPVLIATATRLICKAWEVNDRAFGSLQAVLLAKEPNQFSSDSSIRISKAVSLRDVCRKDADRGVDLILAIEGSIQHKDPLIQSLGLQSLAHLCEADVIDFYTAWDVIAAHVLNYTSSGIVAYGLCLLLRCGAGDAEAYPEAAVDVVKILWEIGTSRHNKLVSWTKARVSAFDSLTNYEVNHIEKAIPDFNNQHAEVFTSETEAPVLKALERFEAKIISYEHSTRRRLVKQKRVPGNKIEKLLDVFPKVLFASGKRGAREQPGAALFYLSFTSKDVNNEGRLRELHDIQCNYEASLLEIAASLRLSRNILFALLSLQSWKPFMRRWLGAQVAVLDSKTGSSISDKNAKAANDILKSIRSIAEDSIPGSAENIALAVGAFCLVLPPSAHAITSTASKFLLKWLFEYEHEYRQWSAAISLGLVSSCLHLTDRKQMYENVTALLEVMSASKSTLVKGACAVGLGFSCQQLLTRPETEQLSYLNKETHKLQEADLLRKIILSLSNVISQYIPSLANSLRTLCAFFPSGPDKSCSALTFDLMPEENNPLEEDIWGVSGLVLGLGTSISAIYRGGGIEPVLHVKELILSCIPYVNPSFKSPSDIDTHQIGLSAGSCLALPIVVSFCQRVELIQDNNEVSNMMRGSVELISELMLLKISKVPYQSLMMAATVGAGSLLSSILTGGIYPLRNEIVNDLLVLFKRTYASPQPPLIHLGGMLGVVNALGAGAGMLTEYYLPGSSRSPLNTMESSYVTGPLLSMCHFEHDVTSLVQDIFLVAQNSEDKQLQQYAAWAVSFLEHYLSSIKHQNDQDYTSEDPDRRKLGSQNLADDGAVMKLSYWLMHLYSVKDATISMETTASVLRCLSHAPRLPPVEWEVIIRRCMRFEGQVTEISEEDLASKRGYLREECIAFALSHASKFDGLLNFLDELLELSRFGTLELNLQLYILFHLADLTKIFSDSRLEKLFYDMVSFLSHSVSSNLRSSYQNSLLRIACWKGLHLCLDDFSVERRTLLSSLENCIKLLIALLPEWHWANNISGNADKNTVEEWTEAVSCLGKVRQDWLLDFLQTPETNLSADDVDSETLKKTQVKARLVHMGSLPFSELANLRACIYNMQSEVSWDVMVDLVAALQYASGSIKRQWLLDVLQISCVTKYPSTALQFCALLCGSCCKYMPILVVNKSTVLSDLPVTLPSLLENTSWMVIAESVVLYLWTSTERIYHWIIGTVDTDEQNIDAKEYDMLHFLLQVMHRTCVALKDYLPPDKRLRLANIVLS